LVQLNVLKQIIKHPIYRIRYGISFFFLWPGFWIHDLGTWVLVFANKLMDLAVAIEGDIPDDDDYQAPLSSLIRPS
jgi:hypothetical protein